MKKIYYLLLLVFPFVLQSCLKEEEDLFDGTPSERMEEALANYKKVLSSSENGWLMEYYAETNQSYGGYNFAMQFTTSNVKAYFELADPTTSMESLYQLVADDGPVLTFDTYNPFLHYFSDPSSSMPDAFEGDYEFKLMGLSDDQSEIYLKGKRSGNKMVLKKLTETPEQYLTKVAAVREAFDAPSYAMTIGGSEVDCSIADNVLTFSYPGDNEEIVSETVAFCYTDKGIHLYEEISINGTPVTEFLLQNGNMVADEVSVVLSTVFPPINELFVTGKWYIAYSTLGAFAKPYYDVVKQKEDAIGETLQIAYMGLSLYGSGKFGFNLISSGYGGSLLFDYVLEGDNKITLQFALDGEGDGLWYHKNAGFNYALVPFGYNSARTFTLTADNPKSPTQITLTEDANPNNVITLFANQVTYPFNN